MIDLDKKISDIARETLETEIESLQKLSLIFNDAWEQGIISLSKTSLPIIITGLGKSGHIGQKIAATFASTGSNAFFIHATEAGHGDLGNIPYHSHVIMLSYSGETQELIDLVPSLREKHCTLISITNHKSNRLAHKADWAIQLPDIQEACPHRLAPTSSTTCMLALGDAMALSLMNLKDFTPSEFAKSHPSGLIGKKLTLKVSDILKPCDDIPVCSPDTVLSQALIEMSSKNFGCILVTNQQQSLCGIITDGDLRRCLSSPIDVHQTCVQDIMQENPVTISSDKLAIDALKTINDKRITALPVVKDHQLIGLIHLHDLLSCGLQA